MTTGRRSVIRAAVFYLGAVGAIAAVGRFLPAWGDWPVGITVIVAYLAVPIAYIERTGRDPVAYGIRDSRPGRSLLRGLAVAGVVLPLFAAVYLAAARWWLPLPVAEAADIRALGWLRSAWGVLNQVLVGVLFAGITEEVFYRGFLQTELHNAWGRPWRVGSIAFGPALPVVAVLFGLPHMLWWGNPWGALVIVPGLAFGFLREWGGSYVTPAVFHGLCNAAMFTLNGYAFTKGS
ncbi:MAG: CPBP family intramembrane glutamic endopeptidase [Planctomycetota bacterium]